MQANAEALPFPDNQFDLITISFGLRNVTHKEAALASMFRVLKPGGRLLVLEFSKPTQPLMSKVYDLYSFNVLPRIGQLVTQDGDSYNRITSYNVCYTKLLRLAATPCPGPPESSADGLEFVPWA